MENETNKIELKIPLPVPHNQQPALPKGTSNRWSKGVKVAKENRCRPMLPKSFAIQGLLGAL